MIRPRIIPYFNDSLSQTGDESREGLLNGAADLHEVGDRKSVV